MLGLLPPECSYITFSSPFEGVSIVQKLVFFLAEEEGIMLPSKVNTVFGKKSLPLLSKGPGIQLSCKAEQSSAV